MNKGYVLALDVGGRRIGVALASLIARLPAPHLTIDRNETDDVVEEITKIIAENSVELLVIGLPRDIKGNETDQTREVMDFISQLEKSINLPIITQDEAVTSIDAEERLKARGKSYSKADIDAEAACIILQDYLNQHESRSA